jgi:hypothetical protein
VIDSGDVGKVVCELSLSLSGTRRACQIVS